MTSSTSIARLLQVSSSLLSRSKSKVPSTLSFQSLVGATNGSFGSRTCEILQDNAGVSLSRNSVCRFRTFCTDKDLASKKCVPCSSKELRPMTEEAANNLIPQVEGWNLINEDGKLKLNRSWKAKSFAKGLELFKFVADIAEAQGHHPDLHLVGWNNITIEIWTHAVGGLTENDFILAAKINQLPLQHLLRKKVATLAHDTHL